METKDVTLTLPLPTTGLAYAMIPVLMGEVDSHEKVTVKQTKHTTKPIVFIDLQWEGDFMRVAVYEKHVKEFKTRITKNDLGCFNELVEDKEYADKVYRDVAYETQYRAKANFIDVIVDLDSKESIIEWNGLMTGDLDRLEARIEDTTRRMTPLFKALGEGTGDWALKTKLPQDADIYRSFDVVDHKIFFCLDVVPAIAPEGASVDRVHMTPELIATYPEEDQKLLNGLQVIIDRMNDYVSELFAMYEDGDEYLKKLLDTTFHDVFFLPLYHQVAVVIPFNAALPAGQALVDAEIAKIINYVAEKDQYLDTASLVQFTIDEEGVRNISRDTYVASLWSSYTESFGKAVEHKLVLTPNDRFKPYSKRAEKAIKIKA